MSAFESVRSKDFITTSNILHMTLGKIMNTYNDGINIYPERQLSELFLNNLNKLREQYYIIHKLMNEKNNNSDKLSYPDKIRLIANIIESFEKLNNILDIIDSKLV